LLGHLQDERKNAALSKASSLRPTSVAEKQEGIGLPQKRPTMPQKRPKALMWQVNF